MGVLIVENDVFATIDFLPFLVHTKAGKP